MAIAETHARSTAQVAQGSRPGTKSPSNEDSVLVTTRREGSSETLLCVVADGVGGLARGEVASQAAIRAMESAFPRRPEGDLGQALRDAVLNAHEAVRREAGDDGAAGGATTMVAAVLKGSELWVANAGDSRAYLLTPGRGIIQITSDHSWVQEQVRAGVMDQAAADAHPHRKVITRCLGGAEAPEVDLFYRRIPPGCRLLLCSDGLTEVVPNSEIAKVLSTQEAPEAVTALLELANRNGATDDATVCVVQPDIAAGAFQESPDEITDQHPVLAPAEKARPRGSRARTITTTVEATHRRKGLSASWLLLLSFPAAVLLLGATLWRATEDTIIPGVSAAGVPLDGKSPDEAAGLIDAAVTPSFSCAQPLLAEGGQWTRSAAELGVSVDAPATASQAWRLGHEGSVADQARQRIDVAFGGASIAPVLRLDQDALTRTLHDLNGVYMAAIPGRAIDVPLAVGAASRHMVEQPCTPLELPSVALPPPPPPPEPAPAPVAEAPPAEATEAPQP